VFAGAATVFFAYTGFDSVANLSEEVINPNRDVPIGIIGSLLICTGFYMGVALVITGMVSYKDIDLEAPLAKAFAFHGVAWAEVCIAFGAFAGLTTTILTLLGAIPRVIMSMGMDGLLPPWFGAINTRFQTPVNAVIVSALLAAVLGTLFDIELLSDVSALGLLVAFTISCCCVLLLRLDPQRNQKIEEANERSPLSPTRNTAQLEVLSDRYTNPLKYRTSILLIFYSFSITIISFLAVNGITWIALVPFAVIAFVSFMCMHYFPKQGFIIYAKPRSEMTGELVFSCPLVPTIPLLAIAINIYMAANLNALSYLLFFGWVVVGMVVYFGYGIRHSRLNWDMYSPLILAEHN